MSTPSSLLPDEGRRKHIADVALHQALVLLPEWIGGDRSGAFWRAVGEAGTVWTVDLATGGWVKVGMDGCEGEDLISLYSARYALNDDAAQTQVAGLVGVNDRGINVLPMTRGKITPDPKTRGRPRHARDLSNLELVCDHNGEPYATMANASAVLEQHEQFRGKIWYDTFQQRVMHSLNGVVKPWDDLASLQVLMFLQNKLKLPKFNIWVVHDAIMHHAHTHAKDGVQDWLKSLTWDGIERLQTWTHDCLGVEDTEYTRTASKNFLVSMVARALVPGCQVDHMIVLEGPQGRGKSSALSVLGGEWYTSLASTFGDKEFLESIQGKWLIEVPDMSGFARREHASIIAAITTRTDRFRAAYARYAVDRPRRCVFAASSETDDYLKDGRGRRRYWPLVCGQIDLVALKAQREQLFAEATAAYTRGEPWHLMPESTDNEQWARHQRDVWTEPVLEYLLSDDCDTYKLTSAKILQVALGLELSQMDNSAKGRLHTIMRGLGFKQLRQKMRYWVKEWD